MNSSSPDVTDMMPTTGEDIGKITWPRVSAEPGKNTSELDGAGPHAYPMEKVEIVSFQGVHETQTGPLSQRLKVSLEEHGTVSIELLMRLAGRNAESGEKRMVTLTAHVRESWVSDLIRGQSGRPAQSGRIAEAMLALSLVPGQRTVHIEECGLSAREISDMLRG